MNQVTACIILALCLMSCIGCSRSTATLLTLNVQGERDMNNGGHFAIVRIYQLTNDTKFSNAEFDVFWDDAESVLAGENVAGTMQQLDVHPSEVIPRQLEIGEGTEYVGVAANLYNPSGNNWKQIYPVDMLLDKQIIVRIRENQLVVDLP